MSFVASHFRTLSKRSSDFSHWWIRVTSLLLFNLAQGRLWHYGCTGKEKEVKVKGPAKTHGIDIHTRPNAPNLRQTEHITHSK